MTAAETLLCRLRYNVFTMQEVAEAASLARETLYLYFKSREALFLGVYEGLFYRWIEWLASFKPILN